MNPAPLAGPVSTLLRLLFPSWAFFDVATAPPRLEIRQLPDSGEPGAWQASFAAPARRSWHLLFNPLGTEVLLHQTQVERFALGLANGDHDSAEQLTTSAIVRAIAEHSVPSSWRNDGSPSWQYRVVIADGRGAAGQLTVVFESIARS